MESECGRIESCISRGVSPLRGADKLDIYLVINKSVSSSEFGGNDRVHKREYERDR